MTDETHRDHIDCINWVCRSRSKDGLCFSEGVTCVCLFCLQEEKPPEKKDEKEEPKKEEEKTEEVKKEEEAKKEEPTPGEKFQFAHKLSRVSFRVTQTRTQGMS